MKSISIFVFLVLLFGSLNAQEVWKITSLDWQPYSGAEISNEGNSVQMLREALMKRDIELLVEFYPWLRSQNIAKDKEGYFGYFPAWPEEVAEGFIASLPVDWSEIAIMKKTGKNISYKNIDEMFKKYKVGVVKTYTYPKEIEDAMKKYPDNVAEIQSEVGLVKVLSSGRADVAITDPNVMLYLAAKEGIEDVEYLETVMKKELVVAVRDNPENRKKLQLLNTLLK